MQMKKFLKLVIVFSAVIAGFILVVEGVSHLIGIPKISHHNIRGKAQNVMPFVDSSAVVFVGDSRVEWGIKPGVFTNECKNEGWTACNLAAPGSNGIDVLKKIQKDSIVPRVIVIGYTAHLGRYSNHGLDALSYSITERWKANAHYWYKQHFYISDKSIWEWVNGRDLYFKSHSYDSLGGAIVYENGDYQNRLDFQVATYVDWKSTFDSTQLRKAEAELRKLISHFQRKGSVVYGVQMPVSSALWELEQSPYYHDGEKMNFDRFLDYSMHIYEQEPAAHDSVYFIDGSHLFYDYQPKFTTVLAKAIKEDYSSRVE